MPLTLTINKLRFPNNANISNPITVTLQYKEYYSATYTTIGTGINVDVDGTILDSPMPSISIEPSEKYMLKSINELCGSEYEQSVILNPYCPVGYELAPDGTYCFYEEITEATPPSAGENAVAATEDVYTTCGSYIYHVGYNVNGTGVSDQISLANPFWVNGNGDCGNHTLTDGPLNRNGLWSTTEASNQDIGFSVCIDIMESKTYYIGIGCDNYGIIKLDSVTIVSQDAAALDIQYSVGGAPFKVWHIYPVEISAGNHILEMIGHNVSSAAGFGCEVYDNTPAEIAAATGYGDLNMIFKSADYIGQPIVLGTDGIGYSCPANYSLRACSSPFECVKLITTPILY
jgi:hypothetical protein